MKDQESNPLGMDRVFLLLFVTDTTCYLNRRNMKLLALALIRVYEEEKQNGRGCKIRVHSLGVRDVG